MKRLLTLMTMGCACSLVQADYFDGGELEKMLDSKVLHEQAMGRGYVAGVQDWMLGEYVCVPEEVLMSQASAIVSKYLAAKPEEWHLPEKQAVLRALQ